MGVEILPVRQAELETITRFLEKEWPDYIAPAAGETVHVGNWMPGNDNYGVKLLVDGALAGFLGASYSVRPAAGAGDGTGDGAGEPFCAIAPWFVMAEHRRHSLPMLMRLLADKKLSYVNLTPTRDMFKLFTTLGFAKLDEAKLLVPPLFNLAFLRPWRGRLLLQPDAIRAALPPAERAVFEAHEKSRCFHAAVVDGDRACYVAAARRPLKNLPFAEILHVSEPTLLPPQMERLAWHACLHLRTVALAIDERLLGGVRVPSVRYVLNAPPLYRSTRVAREKIDNLYSELVL